jgi:hypothetical protein
MMKLVDVKPPEENPSHMGVVDKGFASWQSVVDHASVRKISGFEPNDQVEFSPLYSTSRRNICVM